MTSPSCVLSGLENPDLDGIMLGLRLQDGRIEVDPAMFPCCAGLGRMSRGDGIQICALQARLAATRELVQRYRKVWPDARQGPWQPAGWKEPPAALLRQTGEVLRGLRPAAMIWPGKRQRPGRIWPLALALTWRFGLRVHVVSPGHGGPLLPPARDLRDQTQPLAILLEQVDRLWDNRQAADFEALVSFAYGTVSFFWCEFLVSGQAGVSAGEDMTPAMAAIQRRISGLRQASPLTFLAPDCLSRLDDLCQTPRNIHHHEGLYEC